MAFTLAEYKKGTDDPRKAGIIQTFLDEAPLTRGLPFMSVNGSTIKETKKKTLNTTAFRAINNDFVSSEGEIEEISEALKIIGGKITVDRAIETMEGKGRVALSQMMMVQSIARGYNNAVFNGDGTGNSFTGLKARIHADQTLAPTAAGALSLGLLDEAIEELAGSNPVIMCNTKMYSRFTQAMRNSGVAGNINFETNQFGERVATYAGIPIVKAGRKADDSEVLGFDEASDTTSLFVVALDEARGVCGVQNGQLNYFAPQRESVANEYDIEWYTNFVLQAKRSALRINGITDSAIIA